MKPIRFDMENVSDTEMAQIVSDAVNLRCVDVFHNHTGKVVRLPDFGTLLVGCTPDTVEPEIAPFLGLDDVVYLVPEWWTLAHICKRLAMFPSTTQAVKNGKTALPAGFSQHQVKVCHVKGVITVFKC